MCRATISTNARDRRYDELMFSLANLFENNRQWAERQTQRDPQFFDRLCDIQSPKYLWIGCADSRVPANEIVGLAPGELFVHRNIANVVPADDTNCMAVVQYAVEALKVEHIIVCGHYGCGGVKAALEGHLHGSIERWIQHIRNVRSAHTAELDQLADPVARWRRLCELNVAAQVRSVGEIPYVREAWQRGQALAVHGWIYDLRDGLLRDLNVGMASL
jgi:carbonic anhydrase